MFDKIFFYRIWQKPFFCISLSVCLYITNLYKLKIYYTPFIFLLIIEWNFRVRNLIRVTGKLRIKYLEFEYQNHIIWIVFFLLLLHVSGFGCTQIPCCNSHSLLPTLIFNHSVCSICLNCCSRSNGMGAQVRYRLDWHSISGNRSFSHLSIWKWEGWKMKRNHLINISLRHAWLKNAIFKYIYIFIYYNYFALILKNLHRLKDKI